MIINCDGLKSSKHSTEFHLEALWSSLKIANRKTLYISSFYRPPNSSTEILDHSDDSLNNRQHNISKIESVQRRAARFVFNDYSRYSHVTPMVQSLGWDSLHHRRLLSQGTMFYKIYMGHVGISLPSDVRPNERPSRAPNCRPRCS